MKRHLALIQKSHELEGKQIAPDPLDRARRTLSGSLSATDAETELADALLRISLREKQPETVSLIPHVVQPEDRGCCGPVTLRTPRSAKSVSLSAPGRGVAVHDPSVVGVN